MNHSLRLTIAACGLAALNLSAATLYVAERYNGNVVAVDTVTGEGRIVASGLGAMIGMAVDRWGRLFVTRWDARTVAAVDPIAGTFRNIATGTGVGALSADPDADILYFGGDYDGVVYRLHEVTPGNWGRDVVVTGLLRPCHAFRDGNRLYVTDNAGTASLYVKDLGTGALESVVAGLGSCHVIDRVAGGHLIVGGETNAYRIDPTAKQVIRVYADLQGPNSVVVDPTDNMFAYVNEQYGRKISRLNLLTGGRTTVTTSVTQPWQIALARVPSLRLNIAVLSQNTVALSWNGGPGLKLYETTTLANPEWQEVAGSEGQSTLSLPMFGSSAFFRLVKP